MELNVNQDTLAKYLQLLQGIIERKHTIPILSNFLVEATEQALYLVATDLDIGIRIRCEAKIVETGTITIPGKRFHDILRELPSGEVTVKLEGNNLVKITSGKSMHRIVGLPSDDYPSFPSFENVTFYPIPVEDTAEMVSQTLFAASMDEGRSVLNGVLLEVGEDYLKMIATDGHRLGVRRKASKTALNEQLSDGESMIIPRKALRELMKIFSTVQKDCAIGFNENKIIFQTEGIQLFSRKIDGKFPNYNHVIPTSNDKRFHVEKELLMSSLKRVSIMSDIKSRGVMFNLQKGNLTLKTSNPEIGDAREDITIDYDGDQMDIMFNSHYILEGLAVVPDKEVLFCLGGKKSPALIRLVDTEDFLYIVMPMQVDQD